MRLLLSILASATFLCTNAQSHLPVPVWPYAAWQPFTTYPVTLGNNNRGFLGHNLYLSPFAGISAGFIFLNGGTSYVTAPVGLALYRPLNQNLTAFTDVSIAPTIFSVNRLYTNAAMRQPFAGNAFAGPYGLNLPARLELGLMYTNDAKTFSISGSVSVEKDSYPIYPTYNTNTRKQ